MDYLKPETIARLWGNDWNPLTGPSSSPAQHQAYEDSRCKIAGPNTWRAERERFLREQSQREQSQALSDAENGFGAHGDDSTVHSDLTDSAFPPQVPYIPGSGPIASLQRSRSDSNLAQYGDTFDVPSLAVYKMQALHVPELHAHASSTQQHPSDSRTQLRDQASSHSGWNKPKTAKVRRLIENCTCVLCRFTNAGCRRGHNSVDRQSTINSLAELLLQSRAPSMLYPLLRHSGFGPQQPKKFVLNVAAMQVHGLRLNQVQVVLAAEALLEGQMTFDLPDIIHRYCEALRDMNYMQDRAKDGFDADPFLLTTSSADERLMMSKLQLLDEQTLSRLDPAVDQYNPRLPDVGRTARIHQAQRRQELYNIVSALAGGLALLIPMIIMTLIPGRICSLSTTSGCVLLFALVVAFWSNLKPGEILAITAAYAAVLVVFVGNTSASDGYPR